MYHPSFQNMSLRLATAFCLSLVVTLVSSLGINVFFKMDIHPSQIGEEYVVHQGWRPVVSCTIYQGTDGKIPPLITDDDGLFWRNLFTGWSGYALHFPVYWLQQWQARKELLRIQVEQEWGDSLHSNPGNSLSFSWLDTPLYLLTCHHKGSENSWLNAFYLT